MATNFKKVCQFNTVFGVPHFDEKQESIDPKLFKLRVDLCREELQELKDAFEQNNLIEVIDALADEAYVIYGLASSFGINLDSEFYKYMISPRFNKNIKITQSNFDKVKLWFEDQGDVFGGKPNIDNIEFGFRPHLDQMFATLKNLEKIDNWDTYVGNLCCLLFKVYNMAFMCGVELDEAFSIVHESNMSKVCTSEEEAKKTVEHYKLNDPRYDSPNYRKSENYWVIFNESTGKILKSINYNPADFSKLI